MLVVSRTWTFYTGIGGFRAWISEPQDVAGAAVGGAAEGVGDDAVAGDG